MCDPWQTNAFVKGIFGGAARYSWFLAIFNSTWLIISDAGIGMLCKKVSHWLHDLVLNQIWFFLTDVVQMKLPEPDFRSDIQHLPDYRIFCWIFEICLQQKILFQRPKSICSCNHSVRFILHLEHILFKSGAWKANVLREIRKTLKSFVFWFFKLSHSYF